MDVPTHTLVRKLKARVVELEKAEEERLDEMDKLWDSREEAVGLLREMDIQADSVWWVYGIHRDQTDPPWIERVRRCVSANPER